MSNWVFLRGLTREARHWGDFPSVFRAVVPDAIVITPDLPGNGAFNHLDSPLNVRDMMECCREDLTRRGMSPPYHLLGLSLGAMVTVEWARCYSKELLPSVLINTSLRPLNTFYERLRPRNYLSLLAATILIHDAEKIEHAIFRMTSSRRIPPTNLIDAWVSYRKERPVTALNKFRQLIAAARYRAESSPPGVPLLILAGLKDALVAPNCSQRISTQWTATLRAHNAAGHDLPLDDGQWVAQRVKEWLTADVNAAL